MTSNNQPTGDEQKQKPGNFATDSERESGSQARKEAATMKMPPTNKSQEVPQYVEGLPLALICCGIALAVMCLGLVSFVDPSSPF